MKAMYPVSAALVAALALSSGAASAQSLKKTDGVLADASGMTVYTFDKASRSTCMPRTPRRASARATR